MKGMLSLVVALLISFFSESPVNELSYVATGSFSIPFSVNLANREPTEEDLWTVTLDGLENAPMPEEDTLTVSPMTSASETYQFGPIYFDQDDIDHEYHYMLRISGPKDPLMTYDSVKAVTIHVKDQKNGTLDISSYAEQWPPVFNNIYYRATGEKELKIPMRILGREFTSSDKWTFYVSADKDVPLPEYTEVVVAPEIGNETEISFGKIKYDERDIGRTYSYTISEFSETDGIVNEIPKSIQIRIVDNGDGTLSTVSNTDQSTFLFENAYHAEYKQQLHGKIAINGRDFIPGDSWTIVLNGDEGTPMPEINEITVTPTDGNSIEFDFGTIYFTEADAGKSYIYHADVQGENAGVRNADSIELKLEVVDQKNGNLTVKSSAPEGLLFEMVYSAEGKYVLDGIKDISGRSLIKGDEWSIHITPCNEGCPMPEEDTINIKAQDEDAPLSFAFAPIIFTEADIGNEYQYIVSETGEMPGVTLDQDHIVYVRISDNYDGTLKIDSSIDGKSLTLVDTYEAAGAVTLKGDIGLVGRKMREGDSWKVVLSADDNVPMPETVEQLLSANISDNCVHFEFAPIHYSLADAGKEYVYTLSAEGDIPGVDSFDPVHITVSITDKGNGELDVNTVYPEHIDNIYHANGKYDVNGCLVLSGRKPLENDSWHISITGDQNAPLPEISSYLLIPTEGISETAFNLDSIHYTEADAGKSYNYTISASSDMPGVTNEENGVCFTVTIEDNFDGTLKISSTLSETPVILRSFYKASGTTNLRGTKVLKGRSFQPGDSWKLSLTADEGTPMPAWTDITVNPIFDQSVAFDFGQVNYTEKDIDKVYTYQIVSTSDVEGIEPEEPQCVKVTVMDNLDGTLTVYNSSDNGLVISSTYSARIPLRLTVNKTITGREFRKGNCWNYTLVASDGAPMPSNNIVQFQEPDGGYRGEVQFDEILFTNEMSGHSYTYTIIESTELTGFSPNSPVSFEVSVEDNLDGTMTLTMSPYADGQIEFNNQYTAKADYDLSGTVVLQNRTFQEGDHWTLTLWSELDQAPQPDTWKVEINPTEGNNINYSFGTLHFSEADIGKCYKYTVSSDCNMPGVINSEDRTIEITVLDNGDGSLSFNVSGDKDPMILNNIYKAHGTIQIEAELFMQNRNFMESDQFEMEIIGNTVSAPMPEYSSLVVKPEINTQKDTLNLDFGNIVYTEENIGKTFAYTISQKTTAPGVEKPAPLSFEIYVEDHGDGTLGVSSNMEKLLITDVYHASGTFSIKAVIGITGRSFLATDIWTMRLLTEPNCPKPNKMIIEAVPENGSDTVEVNFGEMIFTEADIGQTYTYTVFQNGIVSGIVNDTPKTLQIQIDDTGNGELIFNTVPESLPLRFDCEYHAKGSINLEGIFSLKNRYFHTGDHWDIVVNAAEDTPMPEKERIHLSPEIGNDVLLKFGTVQYTEADIGKEYVYTFSEVGSVKSVKNDTDKVLFVQIADNGDGTLNVIIKDTSDALEFINLYTAKGDFALTGAIRMLGRQFQDEETWSVQVKAGTDETPLPEVTDLIVVSEKGTSKTTFSFVPVHLTQEDLGKTFRYIVHVSGGNGAIRIDSPKEFTMTVADNGDGTLKFIMDLSSDGIIFENSLQNDCDFSPDFRM